MDVDDEDLEDVSKKMYAKLKELEDEMARAHSRNEDTSFFQIQIDELREFMQELEDGLDEVTGKKGTKRDRVEAANAGTTGTKGAFVSKVGKAFKDWIHENQEF